MDYCSGLNAPKFKDSLGMGTVRLLFQIMNFNFYISFMNFKLASTNEPEEPFIYMQSQIV